ncbi:MAG: SGNH/GDSL hydrolase family protein [Bacteroidota bacterium]
MKANTFIFAALVVIGALVAQGCTDSAPSGPSASLGSVTVTKYVAIGNSLTAGYQSNALYHSSQIYSYPKLISDQLDAAGANLGTFQQPLYSDPGNADPVTGKAAQYQLISFVGPVIGPTGQAAGAPENLALARPYDNLGVPGAIIYDFLDTTNFASKGNPPRSNGFFSLVLRNSAFGGSILAQAHALNPDLVTFWLGNNDVLGYATSGGTSMNIAGTVGPTPSSLFQQLYGQALSMLRTALPNAKILVGNIPDVKAIPFFTTVGPEMAAGIKAAKASNPAIVGLFYEKHGEVVASSYTNFNNPQSDPLITLEAGPYAALLGYPTGQWYRDNGYPSLPAGIDTTKPFGFHPQNPFPDALVLDSAEQATTEQAISDFNNTISASATQFNAAVVDFNGFFNSVKQYGVTVNGETFKTDYVSGGLFSLDGVHPTSKGYGILANQYIKTMNAKFGMHVPYVNINTLPGLPTVHPLSKAEVENVPIIPYRAWKSFNALWQSGI